MVAGRVGGCPKARMRPQALDIARSADDAGRLSGRERGPMPTRAGAGSGRRRSIGSAAVARGDRVTPAATAPETERHRRGRRRGPALLHHADRAHRRGWAGSSSGWRPAPAPTIASAGVPGSCAGHRTRRFDPLPRLPQLGKVPAPGGSPAGPAPFARRNHARAAAPSSRREPVRLAPASTVRKLPVCPTRRFGTGWSPTGSSPTSGTSPPEEPGHVPILGPHAHSVRPVQGPLAPGDLCRAQAATRTDRRVAGAARSRPDRGGPPLHPGLVAEARGDTGRSGPHAVLGTGLRARAAVSERQQGRSAAGVVAGDRGQMDP